MPNNRIACLGLIIVFSLALPASAEFYQYVDTRGITHFTDNPSTIPLQYQSQVALPPTQTEPPIKIPALEKLTREKKMLLEKKDALDRKFEFLTAEKARIEKTRRTLTDDSDIALYNQLVKEINEKIQKFKKEEKRFMLEIKRYNASIKFNESSLK